MHRILTTLFVLAHAGHDHAEETSPGPADPFGDLIPYLVLAAGVLAAIVVIAFILSKLRRKKPQHQATTEPERVDIASLNDQPLPASGPRVEVYNVPMRLALVVLAPVGRDGEVPPSSQLPEVIDAISPSLMQVINHHQPNFQRWPPQLSSQGFSQVFFNNVPLPGDGGKNTRWCALAGRFDTSNGPLLAGLVCVAEKPNAIGQVAVSQPGQWLDILRVKA